MQKNLLIISIHLYIDQLFIANLHNALLTYNNVSTSTSTELYISALINSFDRHFDIHKIKSIKSSKQSIHLLLLRTKHVLAFSLLFVSSFLWQYKNLDAHNIRGIKFHQNQASPNSG